jgi:hypothetical protein
MTESPDAPVVKVFRTDDPALLPLATMALEGEGIEYQVRHAGKDDSFEWQMSQTPTTRPVVVEIVVASDVAARARDLLVDLEGSTSVGPAGSATFVAPVDPQTDPPTVTLEDADSGLSMGTISESQLQELTTHLEEEQPQQYYVTPETVEMLQDAGAHAALVATLRAAVSSRPGGVSVRWIVRS